VVVRLDDDPPAAIVAAFAAFVLVLLAGALLTMHKALPALERMAAAAELSGSWTLVTTRADGSDMSYTNASLRQLRLQRREERCREERERGVTSHV
jgi:hypothetical protein